MPTVSPETELLAWVSGVLNGDTELKTQTGLNPASGAARAVAIYNRVAPDAAVPYVRFHLTDSLPIDDEPFDVDSAPEAHQIGVMVNVFSDYEPEVLKIAARCRDLLKHSAITTANFNGSSWLGPIDYFTDNLSEPDRVFRRASMRVGCRLQPN